MAVNCTQCGTGNPDYALNCGLCSEAQGSIDTTATYAKVAVPPWSPTPPPATMAKPVDRSGRPSEFALATLATAIGIALGVVSFVLYIYYYEGVMNLNRDYESLIRLHDVVMISMYAGSIGWIAVISGVALAIKGLMGRGFESASATLRKVDLKSVLWLLVLLLVVLMVSTAVMILMDEFGSDLGYDASRLLSRMYMYVSHLATVVEGVVVLVVVNSLRKAEALERM